MSTLLESILRNVKITNEILGTAAAPPDASYTVKGISKKYTTAQQLQDSIDNDENLDFVVSGQAIASVISQVTSATEQLTELQNQINGVLGGVIFQSVWNASTNSPTLTSSVGTKGYYYIVSVAGSTSLDGITDWVVGDWAIYDGTVWRKVDNTDAVSSVNGFTGAVNLTTSHITEGSNLYFTNGRVIASTLTGYTSGAGTVSSADTILQAIQKLNGNITTLISSGTTNYIPKFNGSGVIVNSSIYDNGNNFVSIGGLTTNSYSSRVTIVSGQQTDLVIIDNGTKAHSKILLKNTATSVDMSMVSYGGAGYVGTESNHPTIIQSYSVERARFFANGNIGFGTATDSGYKLDVNGTGRFTGNVTLLNNIEIQGVDSTNVTYYGMIKVATDNRIYISSSGRDIRMEGKAGFGVNPTAILHLKAGTATANTAPLKFTTSGAALLTTPEAGVLETDGTDLFFTNNAGVRKQVTLV